MTAGPRLFTGLETRRPVELLGDGVADPACGGHVLRPRPGDRLPWSPAPPAVLLRGRGEAGELLGVPADVTGRALPGGLAAVVEPATFAALRDLVRVWSRPG